MARASPGA